MFWNKPLRSGMDNSILFNSQQFRVDHSLSAEYRVINSVPQCSLLCPFLFIVYIYDILFRLCLNCKVITDNVKLYSCIDNVSSVDAFLEAVFEVTISYRLAD